MSDQIKQLTEEFFETTGKLFTESHDLTEELFKTPFAQVGIDQSGLLAIDNNNIDDYLVDTLDGQVIEILSEISAEDHKPIDILASYNGDHFANDEIYLANGGKIVSEAIYVMNDPYNSSRKKRNAMIGIKGKKIETRAINSRIVSTVDVVMSDGTIDKVEIIKKINIKNILNLFKF